MSETTEPVFELYFTSRLVDGYDRSLAEKKLAQTFNLPIAKIQILINKAEDSPILIRDNISHSAGKDLAKKIRSCGYNCELVPKFVELAKEEVPVGGDFEKSPPKVVIVTCPKCYHKQDMVKGVNCDSCGIAINKINKVKNNSGTGEETAKNKSHFSKQRKNKDIYAPPKIFGDENIHKLKIAIPLAIAFIFLFEYSLTHHYVRLFTEVLVHEAFHTTFFWLYGYFAIPTIDYTSFGVNGDFLMSVEEQTKIVLYFFFILGGYLLYRSLPWPNVFIGLVVIYLIYFFTSLSPIKLQIITFMGYGSYPLIAGICLFSGFLDKYNNQQFFRVVYLIFGFYFTYISFKFLMFFPIDAASIGSSKADLEKICQSLNITPLLLRIFYASYTILTLFIFTSLYKSHEAWMSDFIEYRKSLSKFGLNEKE